MKIFANNSMLKSTLLILTLITLQACGTSKIECVQVRKHDKAYYNALRQQQIDLGIKEGEPIALDLMEHDRLRRRLLSCQNKTLSTLPQN